jgi:hypothetical protein
MTNADRKAAIRGRMAATGENYTTAKRAIEQARGGTPEPFSTPDDLGLERAVYDRFDKGTVAGFLAQELYSTAMWRYDKAAEYPDDARNLSAAEHLADLTRQILALPGDDPRIVRMEGALRAIADANGELPATSEITRTIGFSWGLPSVDELLDRYTQEHTNQLKWLRHYVTAEDEEAMPAALRIVEVLNIGLDEVRDRVIAAIQKAAGPALTGEGTLMAGGAWGPAAALSGEGTLVIGATATAVAKAAGGTVYVTDEDYGYGTDLEAVPKIDARELSEQASQGGLARMNADQRIAVAAVLLAAILQVLPPEARQVILDEAVMAAAIAALLQFLFKR